MNKLCLVTGATGYVGGRLVPALLDAGYRVRVLARHADRVAGRDWSQQVEVVQGDAGDAASLATALGGVDVAYYLVHALGTGADFEAADRRLASTFAGEAHRAGVSRLVYLGGLTPADEKLSPHLRSRAEVGEILLASGVPTAVLRAAVVLGSGSLSFEMLRHLTERLPAMITPRWVQTRIQPIAIRDVLHYLVGAASLPPEVSRGFDIGGPDVLTYAEMMQRYARIAGLRRRRILAVPVLSPSLSSRWIGLVTPVPPRLARPLVESLRNTVVCRERDIAAYVPDPPGGLLGFDQGVELAIQRVREFEVPTSWSSASEPGAPREQWRRASGVVGEERAARAAREKPKATHAPGAPLPTDPDWAGGHVYVDERECVVDASPEALWQVIEGIGGDRGWYSYPLLWWARGLLDRLSGGPGLRRGRRDPQRLRVGEALDWWRVEAVEHGQLLRLRAEMRLPGLAWLDLRVRQDGPTTVFVQRAVFHPHGLAGHAYWWSVWPFHGLVFGEMQQNVARAAQRQAQLRSV